MFLCMKFTEFPKDSSLFLSKMETSFAKGKHASVPDEEFSVGNPDKAAFLLHEMHLFVEFCNNGIFVGFALVKTPSLFYFHFQSLFFVS